LEPLPYAKTAGRRRRCPNPTVPARGGHAEPAAPGRAGAYRFVLNREVEGKGEDVGGCGRGITNRRARSKQRSGAGTRLSRMYRYCCVSRFSLLSLYFFFSSRRRHTRFSRDWSSDVCSSDFDLLNHLLKRKMPAGVLPAPTAQCSPVAFILQQADQIAPKDIFLRRVASVLGKPEGAVLPVFQRRRADDAPVRRAKHQRGAA